MEQQMHSSLLFSLAAVLLEGHIGHFHRARAVLLV